MPSTCACALSRSLAVGPQAERFASAALALPFLDRVVARATRPDDLPSRHPGRAITLAEGETVALVCAGATCSLPIRDAALLPAAVRGGAPQRPVVRHRSGVRRSGSGRAALTRFGRGFTGCETRKWHRSWWAKIAAPGPPFFRNPAPAGANPPLRKLSQAGR